MDVDAIFGLLIVALGWILIALIPFGVYILITKRDSRKWWWTGICAIILGCISSPAWLPIVAVTYIFLSGESFS